MGLRALEAQVLFERLEHNALRVLYVESTLIRHSASKAEAHGTISGEFGQVTILFWIATINRSL